MTEANKAHIVQGFEHEATELRRAAQAAQAAGAPPLGDWTPREVLAHIAFWAVQATQHFRLRLPPLDYGDAAKWGPELFGTFSAAFAHLAGPGQTADQAAEVGWREVANAGVSLPLPAQMTPESHMRVDEAFNAGAVALVRDQPFERVLHLTERAHADFHLMLVESPPSEYATDGHLYRRMLLVIEHHVDHRRQLEAQLATVISPRA